MPAEHSPTKAFFGNLFKKKSKLSEQDPATKEVTENPVEQLERSLTKDDPLLESNIFNGDKEDERKNSKNKRREEESGGLQDEENKENRSVVHGLQRSNLRKVFESVRHRMRWSKDAEDPKQTKTIFSYAPKRFKLEAWGQKLTQKNLSNKKTAKTSRVPVKLGRWQNDASAATVQGHTSPSVAQSIKKVVDYESTTESPQTSGISYKTSSHKRRMKVVKFLAQQSDQVQASTVTLKPSFETADTIKSDASSSEDRPLRVSDLDYKSCETLWQASSATMSKLHKDEKFTSADQILKDAKPADEDEEDLKESPSDSSSKQKKKKKWKVFKFVGNEKKLKDDSVPDDDDIAQTVESAEENETSFITSDNVEKEDTVVKDQPSTSQQSVSDDLTDEVKPVPSPRHLPAPEASTVQDEESHVPKPARRRRRKKVLKIPAEAEPKTVEAEPLDKTQHGEHTQEEPGPSTVDDNVDVQDDLPPPLPEEDDEVLAVTVHHSDHLRADLKYMAHPVVRVSIVDGTTGSYLQKSTVNRRVTSYYESEHVTTVLPIMTQPFDFKANQSVLPRWEETMIFNESFQSLARQRNLQLPPSTNDDGEVTEAVNLNIPAPCPILFFVIRDFVSMAKANNMRKAGDDTEKGWHTVAWAFLKLVGSNGLPNIGHKVRLQLFHPPRLLATATGHQAGQSEPAFTWWRDHPRQTYPSTLYVTLKAVKNPETMGPAARSMFATQAECGLKTFNQLKKILEFADGSQYPGADEEKPKWSRLPGQTCKIPNAVALRLWSGSDGAFTIRFSNKGLRLAVACKHGNAYPILLYGIPRGEEMGVLNGHQQLVYDIQWSHDDERVVTSSGDGTAQVWKLSEKSKAIHTLPHPAYVYTGAFHPSAQHIVATGGYDAVVRVWSVSTPTAQILQELEGHKSFINSLAFDFSGLTMYSADSSGMVVAWNCHSHEKPKKTNKSSWSLKTKFVEKELMGICINSIQVHKGNNKLLLHCRDSTIRMLDVRINTIMHFTGLVNHRQFMRSALTSCGSFVISGSEDGCAYVWNADTGDQVAIYNELGFSHPVRDISFHPHEHMVAFCSFSPNMPVLVFKYDAMSVGAGILSVVGSTMQPSASDDLLVARAESQRQILPPLESLSTTKVDRIKKQLDSVLAPSPIVSSPRAHSPQTHYLSPRRFDPYASYGPENTLSTWGSTFDTKSQTAIVQPSFMSPHASPETRVLARHLAASQPKIEATTGWKPTFTAVGGSPYRSDNNASPGPGVSLAVDDDGNKSLRITTVPGMKPQHKVVALYDYQANRSDELTMMRGDVIKVLYKDSSTWWFGERVSDGKQGYFPTNYVAGQDDEGNTEEAGSPEVLFGVPSYRPDSAESEPSKTVHALKMASGKVHFYSQSESDGDDDKHKAVLSLSSRQRRRDRRSHSSPPVPPAQPVVAKASTSQSPRQSSPRSEPSFKPRKLPTPSKSTGQSKMEVEEIVTETTVAPLQETPQPKPEKRRRKERSRSKSSSHKVQEETVEPATHVDTLGHAHEPVASSQSDVVSSRPRFGVLKAVQAKMAEQETFSKTVLGGSELAGKSSQHPRLAALSPLMTSTATKSKKSRSRAHRTSAHDRDDDVIPMVPIGKDEVTEMGISNLAYDDDISEV